MTRVGLGKVALANTELCFSQDVQALIGNNSLVEPDYSLYYLSHAAKIFKYENRGTTISGVTKKQLAELLFALPPFAEQKRIVAEIEQQFTRLEAGVASLKRARANLRRYKAAVLKAACEGRVVAQDASDEPASLLLQKIIFSESHIKRAGHLWGSGFVPELSNEEKNKLPEGWTWVKVKNLGPIPDEVVQVGPMSMRSQDFEKQGVPVLNVGCVQWGHIDETKLNFLPQDKAFQFNRYLIKEGDVLFTRSGTVGRCAVAQSRQTGWLMTFHLLRVRVSPEICLPDYLRTVFEGAPHIRRQTKEASIGTTRAGFNTNLLAMLDVPLPPIAEQKRIMVEVERQLSIIQELEATLEANLKRAERLRQSILKRAFEGKLVPQDPNDEPASVLLERIRKEREVKEGQKQSASRPASRGREKGQGAGQLRLEM